MDDHKNRIDARIPCRLDVALVAGKSRQRARTEDVGQRGVFVRTDTPPKLRQLVRLEITLPAEASPLSVHGMAVHVIEPGGPRVPGVGVQFYAVDGDTSARWAAFLGGLHAERAAAEAKSPPAAPDEPLRRRHPRAVVELELQLESVDQLVTLYTRDVSAGGMFIVTDLELDVGAELHVDVHHPLDASTFSLDAAVRRAALPPEPRGLGVEFVGMDAARRRAFLDFVTSALPPESVRLVPAGDPALMGVSTPR